jgi:lysophospholipase L1-like esterase
MTEPKTKRIRLVLATAALLLLCLALGARIVFELGAAHRFSLWTDSLDENESAIEKGQLNLQKEITVSWDLLEFEAPESLGFKIDMRCRWIGQLFFSVGGEQAYLLHQDAKEYIPYKPFAVELIAKQKRLHLRRTDQKNELHATVAAPGTLRKLEIRASQSDCVVPAITVFDPGSGKTLDRTRFGPDFSLVNGIAAGILLFLLLAGIARIEAAILRILFHLDKNALLVSFVTAWLPMAISILVLKPETFFDLAPNLIWICLAVRYYLAFSERRKWGGGRRTIFTWILLGATVGLGCFALVQIFRGMHWVNSLAYASCLGGGAAALSFALFFFVRRRSILGTDPAHLLISIWIFPGLANVLFLDEPESFAATGFFVLLTSTILTIRYLKPVRMRVPAFGAVTLVLAVLAVGFIEGMITHSPYETRLRPMNMGTDFTEHELLFWAPKHLFARDNPSQRMEDFQVLKMNFRTGPTPYKKPPGTFRILALGGSNTWGQWIGQQEKTWTGVLEKELNRRLPGQKIEVINGGVQAYSLFQMLVLYKEYLQQYELDMIILYVNINDRAAWARKGKYSYRELFQMRTNGKLDQIISNSNAKPPAPRSAKIAQAQKFLQRYSLYNALVKAVLAFRASPGVEDLDLEGFKSLNSLEDYRANIEEFAKIGRESGATVLLADEFTFFRDDAQWVPEEFQNAMEAAATDFALPIFKAHEKLAYEYTRSSIVFPWDTVHLNFKGHAALGNELADYLIEKDLLND